MARRTRRNPVSPGMAAYRTYYAEQKARGRTPNQIRAQWTRKKAGPKKSTTTLAALEIYKLADRLLGHSDFLHSAGMMEVDDERQQIAVELPRSRSTKAKKGWSTWDVDTPQFIAGLRKIAKKYKLRGVKMTVAVKNPMRAKKNPKVARSIPDIKAKYAELLALYTQGEIGEGQYLRLKDDLVRKGKKAGIGHTLAQMERQAAKGRRRGSRLHAADRRDHEDAPAVSQWHIEAWLFEKAMRDENFEAAEKALKGMKIALSQMSNNRPNAYEKDARRRLIRARTYPRKTPKIRNSEVRELYSQQLTDDASGWAPSERVPDDPFADFMYPEGSDEWFARNNPFWVSPAGTAGYLSADQAEGIAGTRFGGHSRYKKKHPSRGRVPKFMERQVRLESPRAELPAGFAIVEVEVIERDQPVTHYKIHQGRQDTGKHARDWNKAVQIAHRLAKKVARANPFWVTPKGSAVHHTDEQWGRYQTKHPTRRLPRQAAREADLEIVDVEGVGRGWKIAQEVEGRGFRYTLLIGGRDSGLYATDLRKAVLMTQRIDPKTLRRRAKHNRGRRRG